MRPCDGQAVDELEVETVETEPDPGTRPPAGRLPRAATVQGIRRCLRTALPAGSMPRAFSGALPSAGERREDQQGGCRALVHRAAPGAAGHVITATGVSRERCRGRGQNRIDRASSHAANLNTVNGLRCPGAPPGDHRRSRASSYFLTFSTVPTARWSLLAASSVVRTRCPAAGPPRRSPSW